jgi:hypothetical protein
MAVNIDFDKISTNLKNLIDLNRQSFAPTNAEIEIVYLYLKSEDNHDNGLGLFGNLLFSAFSLIGSLEGLPCAPIIAWFLSGVVQSYDSPTPPPNLIDPDITKIKERNLATNMQIDSDLTYLLNHIEENLDKVYNIPDKLILPDPFKNKKTITLRELQDYDIPDQYSDDFVSIKNAHIIGFRNELVKQELPRVGGYAIGTVQRRIQQKYWLYIMHCPGESGDEIHSWNSNDLEISNSELQRGNHITLNGNNFDDFNRIMGSFCDQVGCALVIPTNKTPSEIRYHKYYMVSGFSDGQWSGWDIPSQDFTNWLFKDDGFGNIVRPESIAMREDIFRNWGITNGTKLPVKV